MRLRPTVVMVSSSKYSNPTLRTHYTIRYIMCEKTPLLGLQHQPWCEGRYLLLFVLGRYICSDDHTSAASAVITVRIRDQNSRLQGSNAFITVLMKCTICERTNKDNQFFPDVLLSLSNILELETLQQMNHFQFSLASARQMVYITQRNGHKILLEKQSKLFCQD